MPSNYTPNYGLSQWVGTDAFSHEDFNADNSTVDMALKAVSDRVDQLGYVKITDVLLTADNAAAKLDVSGVNFDDYLSLELFAMPEIDTQQQIYYDLCLNGSTSSSYYTSTDAGKTKNTATYLIRTTVENGSLGRRRFQFTPPVAMELVACTSPYFGLGGQMQIDMGISSSLTWADVYQIDFMLSSGRFKAGSRFWLMGVKKI
jgi:hypothetical protein